MKKTAITLLILSTLTACGTPVAQTAMVGPTTAAAAASQKGFMATDKADSGTQQKSVSKLKALKDSTNAKAVSPLQVKLPSTAGSIAGPGFNDVRSVASMTLSSMNQARTWEDGCRIAYAALDRLNEDTNYRNMMVRTGYAGAKACTRWDSAYPILVLTLNNLSYGNYGDGNTLFTSTVDMLNKCKNWEDGAKAGYAILDVIQGAHPNPSARRLASIAYNQAKSVSTWEDAYHIIERAMREMSYQSF